MIRRLGAWLFHRRWYRSARFVSRFYPEPTDRAHLLIAPTPEDGCEVWTPVYDGPADCMTDGHYLCRSCSRRDPDPKEQTWKGFRR
jgi:hypothetical protein